MAGITFDAGLSGIQSGLQQASAASEDVLDAFESGDTDAAVAAIVELSQARVQVAASAKIIDSDKKLSRYVLDILA